MVEIKRLLSHSYYVECANSDILNNIQVYLVNKELGGFDKSHNTSALFHTDKMLKGVVKFCMLHEINFEVKF